MNTSRDQQANTITTTTTITKENRQNSSHPIAQATKKYINNQHISSFPKHSADSTIETINRTKKKDTYICILKEYFF